MKKTVLSIIIVIALGSFIAVFYPTAEQTAVQDIRTAAQKDTELDIASGRALMDYSLSALGEKPLDQIQSEFTALGEVIQPLQIDERLFATYLQYKQALVELEPNWSTLDSVAFTELHQSLLALQQRYFTDEQIALLFAEENQLRALAIEKIRLQSSALNQQEQQEMWQAQLADLPEYIQQSDANRRLIGELSQTEQEDRQTAYLKRAELVGDAGAQRLSQLDAQRQQFANELQSYLLARSDILQSDFLSTEQKQQQIEALRANRFAQKQWRRVEALERIQDALQSVN
ncbi:lipase secretion chaperone [Vibrio navarrensis]|uniref:lipase secretion chaperone n=1 Tax=Vibrio navarrensis TaxID=29495 RepID=UPI0018688EB3|nr:lipase secretion chaperone [Vibrio navarrensis]MBE3651114.1 lipase chaperone [Vibrio navarrensis]